MRGGEGMDDPQATGLICTSECALIFVLCLQVVTCANRSVMVNMRYKQCAGMARATAGRRAGSADRGNNNVTCDACWRKPPRRTSIVDREKRESLSGGGDPGAAPPTCQLT